jgi:hypothetical protein
VLDVLDKGKGDSVSLWRGIDAALFSSDFRQYTAALSDGKEKVIIFDIASQAWSVSRDLFDIARLKSGYYVQLPHKPSVLVSGKALTAADVYNYLYCVPRAGIDCSGFVWQVLCYAAAKGGIDLPARLSRSLGVPVDSAGNSGVSYYIGTSFFNSKSREIETVDDKIDNLRPGDILLFMASDGTAVHSALIQSIDREQGLIRYLQSTDEAPQDQRGVHESFISFDPSRSGLSLKDPSLKWSQQRYPPFPGEMASPFSNDGDRYRAYPESGGGKVVRLKIMSELRWD